jgi:hypothetical protein
LLPCFKFLTILFCTLNQSFILFLSLFCFLFFSFLVVTQGFGLQSRCSSTWATSPVPFALVILEVCVLWTTCLGWPQTAILPISASQAAKITGVSQWYLAESFFLNGTLILFYGLNNFSHLSDNTTNSSSIQVFFFLQNSVSTFFLPLHSWLWFYSSCQLVVVPQMPGYPWLLLMFKSKEKKLIESSEAVICTCLIRLTTGWSSWTV